MKVILMLISQKFEFKPKGKIIKEAKTKNNYEEIITTIFKAKHDNKIEKNVKIIFIINQ